VVRGVIGCVISTQELVAQVERQARSSDASVCDDDETLASVEDAIRRASDVLADGSQDPAKTCDGISIGLGFDARLSGVGGVVTRPAPPMPCGP
jgi:hypothetical protein